jgi:sec-independent protein translocase protein TatA
MIGNLAIGLPQGWEWIVILVVALLIFGSRLPEVGRSIGRGIVEFKRGLKGVKDEMDEVSEDVNHAGEQDDPHRQLENESAQSTRSSSSTEARTSS